MRRHYLTIIIVLILLFNIFLIYTPENKTKGTAVSGEFSGYFTLAGSPYIITDNVTIPFSGFLDVAAGVTVKFNEGAVLHCKGEMYANGTKTNPIIFTSNLGSPYIGSWKGIRLYLAANSRFINCKISYAWWGINAETGHNITIKNTEIFKCGNGTEFNSISIVEFVNNRIHDNINYGINISLYCSFFNIKNNKFYNNYQGCRFRRLTHSDVVDNSIYNNVRGIRLEISRYLLIKNNTINNTGPLPTDTNVTDFDIAFYMYFSYWNLLQNNDIIDTTGSALVLNISFYNQIENTYIKNASAYGIRFNRFCSDNVIQNSTVLDIGKPLISINYSNRDNYFKNNTLTKPNNLYAVEYGEESYGNYFAADNKVNNVVLPIYYRESSQNISSGLNNLLLTEPKLTNIGQVVIVESENFSVKNLKARNGIAGLFTYETHNVTIDNSEMTNNEFGFYFGYNTTNITVVNSTITNSAKKDFYLDEFSNITVLNSSFDETKIVNRYHSNITIQWYVHVKVIYYKDLEKRFVKRANVKIHNVYNEQTLSGTTGSNGTIRFIRITDYVRNDTGKTSFNDYNVSASKINFQPGYAGLGVFVNQSKWVIIEVQINQDPSMTGFVSPGNTHNLKPELSWKKGTDPEKDPLLYLLRIWNVNDASNIIEQNTTINTRYSLTTNLTYGERYQIEVNASDPHGGWSNTIIGVLDVINNPPSLPHILILPAQTSDSPSKNQHLNCTIIIPSTDVDFEPKDSIKYSYLWYKNGILQTNVSVWNTTKLFHILPKKYTATGETWTCEVLATDGYVVVGPVSESRIIRNQPPRVRVHISPLYLDEDTFDDGTINLTKAFVDDDNDRLSFSYNITGDNISIIILENSHVFVRPDPDWSGYELIQFFAFDGELMAQTTTKIAVNPINDPPMVRILYPINNTPFLYNESQGITLEGVYEDVDTPFGDVVNLTWTSNISGVLGHTKILRNVKLDIGYHKIDLIAIDKEDIMCMDTRYIYIFNESKPPPDITIVELESPVSGIIQKTTTVQLFWKVINLSANETENILFDIYLYPADQPEEIFIEHYVGMNITIPNLEEGFTYYWTIVPYRNNTQGLCVSGVWNFTIDPGFVFRYGFEFELNVSEMIIDSGEIISYKLTIRNTGNTVDNYKLKVLFQNNSNLKQYTLLEKYTFKVKPMRSKEFLIVFNIPKNYSRGIVNDTITIRARSDTTNDIINESANMIIIGHAKKPKQKHEPTPEEIEEMEKKKTPDIMDVFILLLFILIIILIVIILFSFILKNTLDEQSRLFFPFKIKRIITRWRRLLKD